MTAKKLKIVYDGDCPFCSRYARLVRLSENFQVELVNARSASLNANDYTDQDIDLNEGMVVDLDGQSYHGADAIWLLSTLSSRYGIWNRLLANMFASRSRARLCYPILRFGRNATLFVLGREPI